MVFRFNFPYRTTTEMRQQLERGKGEYDLHLCVLEKTPSALRQDLSSPDIDLSRQHPRWGTPLHVALWADNTPAVEALLRAGADPVVKVGDWEPGTDKDLSWSPLCLAAALGQIEALRLLLLRVTPDSIYGDAPGHWDCCVHRAALFGQASTLLELLDWHDAWPQTLLERVLDTAAGRWHADVVSILLTRMTYTQPFLERAMRRAISRDLICDSRLRELPHDGSVYADQRDVIEMLIEQGANPNSTLEDQGHLVPEAARSLDSAEALRVLLDGGADPNGTTQSGLTALHLLAEPRMINPSSYSSRTSLYETGIRLLLKLGASATKRCPQTGNTPLHLAACQSRLDIFRLYLSSCCSTPEEEESLINATVNFNGDTLLHFAAVRVKTDIIEFLLSRGADVNVRNKNEWTPLISTLFPVREKSDLTDTVQDLEELNQSMKAARLLLSHGADPTATTQNGWTPLHCLAYRSDLNWEEETEDLADVLIARGASISARAPLPDLPVRPIGVRRRRGGPSSGAKLHSQREVDQTRAAVPTYTPLQWAAEYRSLGVIKALLNHQAPPAPLDSDEISPAAVAAHSSVHGNLTELKHVEKILDVLEAAGYTR